MDTTTQAITDAYLALSPTEKSEIDDVVELVRDCVHSRQKKPSFSRIFALELVGKLGILLAERGLTRAGGDVVDSGPNDDIQSKGST